MKRGTNVVRWRPLAGVVFAGALAIGVGAFAAPRSGPESTDRVNRDRTRVQSEAAELVSGDSAHLLSVVAGSGAGAKVELFPVPARVGSYPASANASISEPTIVRPIKGPTPCNEIALNHGGFDIWMEWKYSDWDDNGDDLLPGTGVCDVGAIGGSLCTSGNVTLTQGSCAVNSDCDLITLSVAQGSIIGAGMLDADVNLNGDTTDDGDQDNLFPALIGCPSQNAAGNTFCVANNGGEGCKCLAGIGNCPVAFCCANMWYAKTDTRADSVCAGVDCQADCDISDIVSFNYKCFAAAESPAVLHDFGDKRFGGYFMVTVPSTAKGRYFIDLNKAATFMGDRHSPPADIPLSEESGACVFIRTGQCCKNLGTPSESCEDYLTKAECETPANAPFLWTQGKTCAEGCVQCLLVGQVDPLCNDSDACTEDNCNSLQLCPHGFIPGFVPGTNCCNPSDGDLDTRDDGDDCTTDTCTLADSRGDASNTPTVGPCLDGNPCTTGDVCDGLQSQADGGCSGSDVNDVPCDAAGVCPLVNELDGSAFGCSPTGNCFCTLTPDLNYVIVTGGLKNPACVNGIAAGFYCEDDTWCPGGFCNEFAHASNCFDSGTKIVARVHIGAAGANINGGQFLITFDASCVTLQSITGLAPYVTTVYGPTSGAGSVFIAVGVDPFLGIPGPLGNVDILQLTFLKTGECDECELCFGYNNPQNTYLVDNAGQRVDVAPKCKGIRELPDLTLNIPGNIVTNVDCDAPTALENWAAPSASSDCGPATISCRGAHETGYQYTRTCWRGSRDGLACGNPVNCPGGTCQDKVMNGGSFPQGASSFCCVATEDFCDQAVGCAGRVNDCPGDPKPVGCWTVTVNDETSLDVQVQLEPPITHTDPNGELTRCIKFTLYGNCAEEPLQFSTDVTFGGLFEFVGKVSDKVKIPGKGKWDCITAQDQQHTLRSCYLFDPDGDDCVDGVLSAHFDGDPHFPGGNWLIGGNLDGWKKKDGDPSTNPSLSVIDILDFGTFVGQYGICYADNDTPCGTPVANADINGDGCTTASDYNFVIKNFLASSKQCCCGPEIGSEPMGVTEITVDELVQMGLGDMAAADLNGDGVLNTQDMDAFLEGARPAKSNNRGGKGVRSGR